MSNIFKLGFVSVVLVGLSGPVFAENGFQDSWAREDSTSLKPGTMNAWGETGTASSEEESFAGKAFNTLSSAGNAILDNGYARGALAWNLNYYGAKSLEEVLAYGAYGVGTLVAGPVAGNASYYTVKGAINAARYVIPGFDGYLAGTLAPITKAVVIDPLVNYGPSIVKGAAEAVYNGASKAYNWYTGE